MIPFIRGFLSSLSRHRARIPARCNYYLPPAGKAILSHCQHPLRSEITMGIHILVAKPSTSVCQLLKIQHYCPAFSTREGDVVHAGIVFVGRGGFFDAPFYDAGPVFSLKDSMVCSTSSCISIWMSCSGQFCGIPRLCSSRMLGGDPKVYPWLVSA
jgi:hypothetical protein